jgi:chemotaxis signal transduction protein
MQAQHQSDTSLARVLLIPSQSYEISGKSIHFLFSIKQVRDILKEAAVFKVPFSPPFVDGIAQWRSQVVPVISLEARLQLETVDRKGERRFVLIRSIDKTSAQVRETLVLINAPPTIRMMNLPLQSTPVGVDWIAEKGLIRGVYEWENKFIIVVHMEKIITYECPP